MSDPQQTEEKPEEVQSPQGTALPYNSSAMPSWILWNFDDQISKTLIILITQQVRKSQVMNLLQEKYQLALA